MGTLYDERWDNDDAADWFADLISDKFVKQIDSALRKDPEEECDTIRAACYVLCALGHNYVWPVEKLQPQLQQAITKLRQVLDSGVIEEGKATKQMRKELKTLQDRLQKLQSPSDVEGEES